MNGPCVFPDCVSRERHWHFGFPGGYENPADPDGPPIPFTAEPAPGVRDYNGAILPSKKVCDRCSHPLNSHHEGRCNVAGPDFVCDCGQPVIVDGEEVIGYVGVPSERRAPASDASAINRTPPYPTGFTSFRDDVA